jgi:hypothetical protein
VSKFKGVGLETLVYGDLDFSIVSGSGRIGAGLSASNSDETFFGNSAKESTTDYQNRKRAGEKYSIDKYSLSVGASLMGKKKKKSLFDLSAGFIAKYNDERSKFLPGASLSGSFWLISFGFSYLKDDGYRDPVVYNNLSKEYYNYDVLVYSAGLSLPYINYDYTYFVNDSPASHRVAIHSVAMFYKSYIFSFGRKKEESDRLHYNEDSKTFTESASIYDTFYGVQYRHRKRFMLGVYHNYYLVNDITLGLTIFI